MSLHRPLGLAAWLYHRLVANYWSLPVLAVLAAPLAAGSLILLDRGGATEWLLARDLAPVATAGTARNLAGIVAGIDTTLLTLYVSISLLVLTIAASNLGVRLIDRWLSKPLVRASLSGFSFSVIFALTVMTAIDADAPLSQTPLVAFTAMLALQLVNLGMLAVAVDDLARTMFIDHSIATIGQDAAVCDLTLVNGGDGQWRPRETLAAWRIGYVEGYNLERLARMLRDHPGRVRFVAAPGSYVLIGDALVELEEAGADLAQLQRQVAVGSSRSNAQGPVFQIRLLIEIAARALSPAVNDFYTAIACADRLACALDGQTERWVDSPAMPVWTRNPRFECPGQDFRDLFGAPLAVLRQAACEYPAVAIRMIENLARLAARAPEPGLARFLESEAQAFADHAIARASFDPDKDAIVSAFSSAFSTAQGERMDRQEKGIGV